MGLKKIFSEVLHAIGFVGPLTGNVTGDVSGSSGSCTGNAATVTTNASLSGPITSVGNATSIASQTGTGTKFVVDTSPVLVTPALGTPSSGVLTSCTGTATGLTAGTAQCTQMAQAVEGTGATVLEYDYVTSGQSPLKFQPNSAPNTGAGTGTYNHGFWYGFNPGLHSALPVESGKKAWIVGMEDNYYDPAPGDAQYGAEWYLEGFTPNGTAMRRPLYVRAYNHVDGNTGNVVLVNTGGIAGQFSVYQGNDAMMVFNSVDCNIYRAVVCQSNLFVLNGGEFQFGGTGYGTFRVAVNNPGAGMSTLVNSWGNASNPGWAVGTTRTDGIAFQVGVGIAVTNNLPTNNGTSKFIVLGNGNVGVGTITAPTAQLHLPASTATANTASLKIDPGVVATTPVSGNIESDGTDLWWTNSAASRVSLSASTTLSKATGAEVITGTDDAKYVTPKAIADAGIAPGGGSSVGSKLYININCGGF